MKSDVIAEVEGCDDAQLVERVRTGERGGDREAFGQLVARYQSPICALAYNACGDIARSEDLAQEAFIIAWRKLGDLKEPGKFRSWLYGIARNLIHSSFRKEGRNPLAGAEPLDESVPILSIAASPAGQAISKEEEGILWRSLEQIPETYREPLILYYRDHESIERVAEVMELSEEATRQRLSRGRKLLQEQVMAFVEGALRQSGPGPAFTVAVLAALPAVTFSAKAVTLGAVAKGGAAVAKGATMGSLLGVWLGPALGILIGYWGYRENRKNGHTPREREFRKRFTKIMFIGALVFCLSLVSLILVPDSFVRGEHHPLVMIVLGLVITAGWAIFATVVGNRYAREFAKLREEERQLHPELFRDPSFACAGWPVTGEVWEYRSRATLLGLPLVHCRFGNAPGQKSRPAVGWIAYGEKAFGILFAGGMLSVGAISMGGASFGILSFGGFSFGLIAFGGFSAGAVALGGAAVGLVASGGIALGWHAALGGMVAAHEYALGGDGVARHFDDSAAQEFFTRYRWLNILQPGPAFLFWLGAFSPTFLQMIVWRWVRRKIAGRVMANEG